MRVFKPAHFVLLVGQLERNLAYLYKRKNEDARRRRFAIEHLLQLRRAALKSGLPITAAAALTSIEHLRHRDDYDVRVHMEPMVGTMRRIVTWEMEQLEYFDLPTSQIALWKDAKQPFGKGVTNTFPEEDIRTNLEEASKCLAFDRGSACVYHLMCALDLSLQKYCRKLRVQYRLTRTWGQNLDKIVSKIDTFSNRTKRQLIKKERHLSVYTHLNAVRAAWRHSTMHSRRHYTPEEALEIFNATKGFMRDLTQVL